MKRPQRSISAISTAAEANGVCLLEVVNFVSDCDVPFESMLEGLLQGLLANIVPDLLNEILEGIKQSSCGCQRDRALSGKECRITSCSLKSAPRTASLTTITGAKTCLLSMGSLRGTDGKGAQKRLIEAQSHVAQVRPPRSRAFVCGSE